MSRMNVWFLFAAAGLDALLTDFGLRGGWIREANPLMRMMYEQAPALFYGCKLLLPLLLVLLVRRASARIGLRIAIGLACVVYADVLILHTVWLTRLI